MSEKKLKKITHATHHRVESRGLTEFKLANPEARIIAWPYSSSDPVVFGIYVDHYEK